MSHNEPKVGQDETKKNLGKPFLTLDKSNTANMIASKISAMLVQEMDYGNPHPGPLPAGEGTVWTPSPWAAPSVGENCMDSIATAPLPTGEGTIWTLSFVSIMRRGDALSNNPFHTHLSKARNWPEMSNMCRMYEEGISGKYTSKSKHNKIKRQLQCTPIVGRWTGF